MRIFYHNPSCIGSCHGSQLATDAVASASRYGGAEIRAAEEQRERGRRNAWPNCAGSSWTVQYWQAQKGVLVESSGSVRRVPAPARRDDTTLVGDGWTFTVKPGFVIRDGPRRGDYEVVRQQP